MVPLLSSLANALEGGLSGLYDLLSGDIWNGVPDALGVSQECQDSLAPYVEVNGEVKRNTLNPWRSAQTDLTGQPWNRNLVPKGEVDYLDQAANFFSLLTGGFVLKTFGPMIGRTGIGLGSALATMISRGNTSSKLDQIQATVDDLDMASGDSLISDTISNAISSSTTEKSLLALFAKAFIHDDTSYLASVLSEVSDEIVDGKIFSD
jgi:hypothetical protein